LLKSERFKIYYTDKPHPEKGVKGLALRGDLEGCNIWFSIKESF
jgi:hypothetical protein